MKTNIGFNLTRNEAQGDKKCEHKENIKKTGKNGHFKGAALNWRQSKQ